MGRVESASRRFYSAGFLPFNPYQKGENTAANLPHWRQDKTTYFVTFRLADSLPKEKLIQWSYERKVWMDHHPEPWSNEEKVAYYERFSQRIESWLDLDCGSCLLRDADSRAIVERALRFFDEERYWLGEHVVAGNHVHAIVTPLGKYMLSDILHSWKSFTAKALLELSISERISTRPIILQKESYDHIVRSAAALAKIEAYIRAHEVR